MRRSGIVLMHRLFALVGSFTYVLILAVINGSIGGILAISITILGVLGLLSYLGVLAIPLWIIIVLLVVSGLLRGLLRYFEQYSNHYIAFKLLAILRDKIFTQLRKLSPAKLDGKEKGGIISLITSDIETLEIFYAHTMSPICIAVLVSLAMALFIGFMTSWYLALFAVVAYVIVGFVMPLINSKIVKNVGVEYRKEFSLFNNFFLDVIKGSKEIVMHNKSNDYTDAINERTNKLLNITRRLKVKNGYITGINAAVVTILTIIMIIVSQTVLEDKFLVILSTVALMSSFGPVLALSALPSVLNQTFASTDRLINLLDEKAVLEDVKNAYTIDSFNTLTINNLSFGYEDNVTVLNNFNAHLNKGEILGIQGLSGCGKSTLLKLILRFYPIKKGEIKINGINIDEINTESLKNNVVMLSQNTYLFADSIKNNVKIAKPSASDDEVVEACKKANIHYLISDLKEGYDTKVGIGGLDLSAGEMQRIGLARAFLSNAELVLLDEPTSNVDSINEGLILNAIKNNRKNKTFILVTHRESTMSIADNVIKI